MGDISRLHNYHRPSPPQHLPSLASLGLYSPSRLDTWTLRHYWQRPRRCRRKARRRRQPLRSLPMVVLTSVRTDPRSAPPEWQVWHKPRDDFPFSPSTQLSAIFSLPRHAATRLFQMKLVASYLLGRSDWHRPEAGLFPRCEEETEFSEHALLRCPAHHILEGPFSRPRTSCPPGLTPLE